MSFSFCPFLKLPRVLDSNSEGVDIHFWVQVLSAASDKLREVTLNSCNSFQPHSKSSVFYFERDRKGWLPFASVCVGGGGGCRGAERSR